MIIEDFKRLAEKYDGKFFMTEDKFIMADGSREPIIDFELIIKHKNYQIKIINSTGLAFAKISSLLSKRDSLEFEMTTRSHFLSLFKRGNRFKLSKKTPNIESFFRKSTAFKDLKIIAKESAFEPLIIGKNLNNKFKLETTYNLIFPNWTQVLEPLILFYKEFIDEFY